jgi:hypothetical protein
MSDIEEGENWKHEWHLATDYCIHCGLHRLHECDPPLPCHREEKVTAISHITQTVGDLFNYVLRNPFKNHNSNSN